MKNCVASCIAQIKIKTFFITTANIMLNVNVLGFVNNRLTLSTIDSVCVMNLNLF